MMDDLRRQLLEIEDSLTRFLAREPQQPMLPESVEYVRRMVRAALASITDEKEGGL